ncbi:MAG TPA: urate hydroxylase PuuD [Longimicrobiales bacterium]
MIDPGVRELLDLMVRWIHVIAGIMWIGNSLLFNWLDRNLQQPREGAELGRIWLIHSGGFYHVEKTLLSGQGLPAPMHWFKWQAYTTWLTGALLLGIVYYSAGGALLINPSARGLSVPGAIALSAGLIALAWPVYDLLWRSPLGRARISGFFALAAIVAIAFALTRVFSARAAFLHMGALLGTLMAGNVAMLIMPSQRQLVASIAAGHGIDRALADRAKARSIHNNYLVFPVIALMLSAHFPGIYGHRYAWGLVGVLVVAGAGVRHFMNIRFTEPRWRWGLAATAAAALAVLYFATATPGTARSDLTAGAEAPTFADVRSIIDRRCSACHSAQPADRTFGAAPGGVSFDSPDQIRVFADRILNRAVTTRTMPPANKTSITETERQTLRRWIENGAQ